MGALPDARIADLLRVGKIGVALFLPRYKTDPVAGEIRPTAPEGVCLVEIARALTAQLGVDLQLIGYPSPPGAMNALKAAECDIGFFGIDPSRVMEINFSPPLVQADFTYLVPSRSLIRRSADADRPGVTVAVVRNHSSTNALSRILRQAKLIYGETPEEISTSCATGRQTQWRRFAQPFWSFQLAFQALEYSMIAMGNCFLQLRCRRANRDGWPT
jgi:polar amino acid transport system substrate-binding protein